MNSDSNQQSNTPKIDASLAEIYTLISALEAQLKSGYSPALLDIKTVEAPMPKMMSSEREEPVFMVER